MRARPQTASALTFPIIQAPMVARSAHPERQPSAVPGIGTLMPRRANMDTSQPIKLPYVMSPR
jgi:hypothetical protein